MLRKKQTITKNSGFTLVEAIVTMMIMLSLMGIILSGLIQAKQRFLVRDSAQQFADAIRQAINDTKNGIKVKDCVIDVTEAPRACSTYIISSIRGEVAYEKYVDVMTSGGPVKFVDPPNIRLLQAGTAFEGDFSLFFTFSGTTFPLVSIHRSGSVGVPGFNETFQITIKSLSGTNIRANICILKSGSVLVQSEPCN